MSYCEVRTEVTIDSHWILLDVSGLPQKASPQSQRQRLSLRSAGVTVSWHAGIGPGPAKSERKDWCTIQKEN